jgi:hypothetical protein
MDLDLSEPAEKRLVPGEEYSAVKLKNYGSGIPILQTQLTGHCLIDLRSPSREHYCYIACPESPIQKYSTIKFY